MRIPVLVRSFRARLLLLLVALLGLVLGVQYYVNLRSVRTTTRLVVEQQHAIMAGVALGLNSLWSEKYLDEIRDALNDPLLDEHNGQVTNVLVVDNEGNILDSLVDDYNPTKNSDGSTRYVQFKQVPLPSLRSAVRLSDESQTRPPWLTVSGSAKSDDSAAFYFPVETNTGRRFVIVVLGSASTMKNLLRLQASQSMLYTLTLLLATMLLTTIFVWKFTRPIKELSVAARRVAGGDFGFRVGSDRQDEIGALASAFNEMTAKLERTRELESQLHQAEKAAVVGRLAAAIAHEIRNPLNYINLTLDHLRSSFSPADESKREKFKRLADQLKAEVARINRHITDFLNYSRPSQLEFQAVNLRDEAEDALHMIAAEAAENGVAMHVEEQGEVPLVLADKEALHSVFTNLVLNALQAMDGEGGKVVIRLAAEGAGRAIIEISDTGRGISPEDIAKVFEPYYSTKETGTGLGLAIVKKAVDDHGGSIGVNSKEGTGTTFTISLPTKPEGGQEG